MPASESDIFRLLMTEEDGLPRPVGHLFDAWVSSIAQKRPSESAWDIAARQWLAVLRNALDPGYQLHESKHFMILAWEEHRLAKTLLKFAEASRSALLASLPGVATFPAHGKKVMIIFQTFDEYYQYVEWYLPKGGCSVPSSIHLRKGYPHIASFGFDLLPLESALAYSLTKASLHALELPRWLEEGLAQLFERQLSNTHSFSVSQETANALRNFWNTIGLDRFWCGDDFDCPIDSDSNMHLAAILTTLLAEQSRPQWFGFDQGPRRRFLSFIRSAKIDDCGNQACIDHFGFDLNHLAERFLGDEGWYPQV